MKMSEAEFERQYAEATRLGKEELRTAPLASAVKYNSRTHCVVVSINKGSTLVVPVDLLQGVQGASGRDLAKVHILDSGLAIEWPTLDQQFSISGLLAGNFGNEAWMSALPRRTVAKPKPKVTSSRTDTIKRQQPRTRKTVAAR
ncbi:MAG: DUF2442 domain-containing protein [Planctomycetaceae bacterium]